MTREQFELKNEELKTRWISLKTPEDKGFVWDGIINYDNWIDSDLKLAFMLKEARSGHGEQEWNIAKAYDEEDGLFKVGRNASQATHYRIVEWAYAVEAALHGRQTITREEAKFNDYEASRKIMLASAYLNLKKIDGKSISNDNNLRSIVKRDKALILEQLELIQPNTILFCSNFKSIAKDILFEGAIKLEETDRCYDKDGVLLIDFIHPSPQSAEVKSLFWLFEDVSKIKNKSKYLK